VKLGLAEDHPASGAAVAQIEGTSELHKEARSASGVRARRPREREQLAVEDLRDHFGRRRLKGCLDLRWVLPGVGVARRSGAHVREDSMRDGEELQGARFEGSAMRLLSVGSRGDVRPARTGSATWRETGPDLPDWVGDLV
jgi:hypothetical protein